MRSGNAILEVRRLTKRFGGLLAVSNLNLDLHQGEVLGLIGPNGAGKSTVFNLIAGALPATAGSVHFAGESILGRPPHEIAARGLMRTYQHNRPFHGMPVVDNVMVGSHARLSSGLWSVFTRKGLKREVEFRRHAEELIQFVGLSEFNRAEVDTLSFGQGRLLEIARALAGEPKVMLLDEPAAGLTLAECDRFAGVIRGIAERGVAVLLIEHDMRFLLPLAQRVAVLDFGVKIAEGSPAEVRRHPAVMDAYLGNAAAG